jgi:hypothetical protein
MSRVQDAAATFLATLEKAATELGLLGDKMEEEFADRYIEGVSKDLKPPDARRPSSVLFPSPPPKQRFPSPVSHLTKLRQVNPFYLVTRLQKIKMELPALIRECREVTDEKARLAGDLAAAMSDAVARMEALEQRSGLPRDPEQREALGRVAEAAEGARRRHEGLARTLEGTADAGAQ